MNQVTIYFIIPCGLSKEDADLSMHTAFECCLQLGMQALWGTESDYDDKVWTKQDVVVFEKFEGDLFSKLRNQKCVRILGPRCLNVCLIEGKPIPNSSSPIFTDAMNTLVICCSGLTLSKKNEIKEKVSLMGGFYTSNLTAATTHLITNCVRTDKYIKACEQKIPVMRIEWVDAVWEASLLSNIKGDSAQFREYQCPIFYNLNITSSGLSHKERTRIMDIINSNGGTYSGKFQSEFTSLVICKFGQTSAKITAAHDNRISCCTIEWLDESIRKGYALPIDQFKVSKSDFLSSTHNEELSKVPSPNFSMMSEIHAESAQKVHSVSETLMDLTRSNTPKSCTIRKENPTQKLTKLIDDINMSDVRSAMSFLDGCSVYLVGFDFVQRDKICKILKGSGAIRYDVMSEKITHVIFGYPSNVEIKDLRSQKHSPFYVSLQWLVESIKLQRPANEDSFIVSLSNFETIGSIEPSSPLGKKCVQILRDESASARRNILTDVVKLPKPAPQTEEISIINEYLSSTSARENEDTLLNYLGKKDFSSKGFFTGKEGTMAPPTSNSTSNKTSTTLTTLAEDSIPLSSGTCIEELLFKDLTFILIGLDDDAEDQFTDIITSGSGKVVSAFYKGTVNYAVVPREGAAVKRNVEEIVTHVWIEDCNAHNVLVPIEYFHKPVTLPKDVRPLEGCVICVSTYADFERSHLNWLAAHLGAITQDIFVRKQTKKDSRVYYPSTHLICSTAAGDKYTAAKKWNIPVVTHQWLVDCEVHGKKLPLDKYSVDRNNDVTSETSTEQTTITNQTCQGQESNAAEDENASIRKVQYPSETLLEPLSKANFIEEDAKNQNNVTNTSVSNVTRNNSEIEIENIGPINKSRIEVENIESVNISRVEVENIEPVNIISVEVENIEPMKSSRADIENDKIMSTPINKKKRMPSMGSQMTPVGKFLENLHIPARSETPDQSPLLHTPTHVDTPELPLGRVFGNPNPSPNTRKYWAKEINKLPHYRQPSPPRRKRLPSTPLSELKERIWRKFMPSDYDFSKEKGEPSTKRRLSDDTSIELDEERKRAKSDKEESTPDPVIAGQLQALQDMLKTDCSSARRRALRYSSITARDESPEETGDFLNNPKESQTETVGWEDPLETFFKEAEKRNESSKKTYRFILSQINPTLRSNYEKIIIELGGEVSDMNCFDSTATHLICAVATKRSEKLLASIAAGLWVLHVSYLDECLKLGYFDDEEKFEFGNPSANPDIKKIEPEYNCDPIYQWRLKINQSGQKAYHGMKALLLVNAQKRDQLVRLVEAGDGTVLKSEPPYDSVEHLNPTHCFVDTKQPNFIEHCKRLPALGVICLPFVYLADMLFKDSLPPPRDCIIPSLKHLYNKMDS